MLSAIFNIIVQPLIYLIELVFTFFYLVTKNPGLAIIGVSIAVNVLCLPLYRMADEHQDREREKQKSMERWVTHIKKHFKGDEQYMMLSTYYDQQGYRPVRALIGSLSLLLQIPFFMAAYAFLSNLELLSGTPFLFLSNLGAPDALLNIGGMSINVLPIAMTLLNCASTVVYTKGLPLRDKLQAYILAGLFLILLYDSPSGLVFYWTCNQLFSLLKNVFMKVLKNPKKWALVATQVCFVGAAIWLVASGKLTSVRKTFEVGLVFVALEGMWLWGLLGDRIRARRKQPVPAVTASERRALITQFLLCGTLLTLLMGVLIPTATISASPFEFIDPHTLQNPLDHVIYATCVWAGVFLLWAGIYFFLLDDEAKRTFVTVMWCLTGVCLVDYFFFGQGLGLISNSLRFDEFDGFPWREQLFNLAVLTAVVALLVVVWKRLRPVVRPALVILCVGIVALSVPNIVTISSAYAKRTGDGYQEETGSTGVSAFEADGTPAKLIKLSKTNQNVMVIFLDRAVSGFVPYIMNERPELQAQLDGFTYYPNTTSFGQFTNFGSPAIYGGYEYTPTNIDARSDVLLSTKQDEALKLMPTLFSEAGYHSFVADPPYAGNYSMEGDVSIFKDLEDTDAIYFYGAYRDILDERYNITILDDADRSFCFYSLFKVIPDTFKSRIYDDGKYLSSTYLLDVNSGPRNEPFLNEYSTLEMLPEITDTSLEKGGFVLLENGLTHEPDFTQLPDYLPSSHINNEGLEDLSRFTLNGTTMTMDRTGLVHYHANAAAWIKVGQWFDWLREQGVYDNTRIIVVSDHGCGRGMFPNLQFDDYLNIEWVNPVLMVKDFNAHGFTTSDEFMTTADVPTIAMSDVIENPVNPATGNPVTNDEKTAHDQIVSTSKNWQTDVYNGTTLDSSDAPWYSVHDNIFDFNNWKRLD